MLVAKLQKIIIFFLKPILNFLGISLIETSKLEEIRGFNFVLSERIATKDKIIRDLESVSNPSRDNDISKLINIEAGDPVPKKNIERREYVADVTLRFIEIWKPKLLHLISRTQLLLEDPTNTKTQDKILKGAIYAYRELVLWGESMVKEQRSYELENVDKESDVPNSSKE